MKNDKCKDREMGMKHGLVFIISQLLLVKSALNDSNHLRIYQSIFISHPFLPHYFTIHMHLHQIIFVTSIPLSKPQVILIKKQVSVIKWHEWTVALCDVVRQKTSWEYY